MPENFAKKNITEHLCRGIGYDDPIEIYLSKLESLLKSNYKISKRSISLLILQEAFDYNTFRFIQM